MHEAHWPNISISSVQYSYISIFSMASRDHTGAGEGEPSWCSGKLQTGQQMGRKEPAGHQEWDGTQDQGQAAGASSANASMDGSQETGKKKANSGGALDHREQMQYHARRSLVFTKRFELQCPCRIRRRSRP